MAERYGNPNDVAEQPIPGRFGNPSDTPDIAKAPLPDALKGKTPSVIERAAQNLPSSIIKSIPNPAATFSGNSGIHADPKAPAGFTMDDPMDGPRAIVHAAMHPIDSFKEMFAEDPIGALQMIAAPAEALTDAAPNLAKAASTAKKVVTDQGVRDAAISVLPKGPALLKLRDLIQAAIDRPAPAIDTSTGQIVKPIGNGEFSAASPVNTSAVPVRSPQVRTAAAPSPTVTPMVAEETSTAAPSLSPTIMEELAARPTPHKSPATVARETAPSSPIAAVDETARNAAKVFAKNGYTEAQLKLYLDTPGISKEQAARTLFYFKRAQNLAAIPGQESLVAKP